MGLGSQVGAKLGGKIEPRQAKTGQDKGRQGKERERKRKGRERQGLEGKQCPSEILRPGGEGLARHLGDLPGVLETRGRGE